MDEPAQGTAKWLQVRLSRVTASQFGAVAGVNPYQSRNDTLQEKLGRPRKPMSEAGRVACAWGVSHEPVARAAYEARTGNICGKQRGCVPHPDYPFLAGSPDGLIGEKGLIEIKCPHFIKVPHSKIPVYYYLQMNGLMEIFDRDWCDYVTWAPCGFKIYRCYRDIELFNWLLPKYTTFFACMQRQADKMPNVTAAEKLETLCRINASIREKVNYTHWAHLEPPAQAWEALPDDPFDECEEPAPQRVKYDELRAKLEDSTGFNFELYMNDIPTEDSENGASDVRSVCSGGSEETAASA
jgi:putative phage-type endonuclease